MPGGVAVAVILIPGTGIDKGRSGGSRCRDRRGRVRSLGCSEQSRHFAVTQIARGAKRPAEHQHVLIDHRFAGQAGAFLAGESIGAQIVPALRAQFVHQGFEHMGEPLARALGALDPLALLGGGNDLVFVTCHGSLADCRGGCAGAQCRSALQRGPVIPP